MASEFTSDYISDTFKNRVWALFSSDLYRVNTKEAYLLAINRICEYARKDFLEIKTADAQAYFNALADGEVTKKNGEKYSATSVYIFYSQLSAVANYIVENNSIYGDLDYAHPFYGVKIKEPSSQIELSYTLSLNDIKKILTSFKGTDLYLIICFAFRLGLSNKMLLALLPSDVLLTSKGDYVLQMRPESKNKPVRHLTIPKDLTEDVKTYMATLPMSSKTLFHNSRNKPLTRKTLDFKIKAEMEKIGYSGVTLQRLRTSAGFHMRKGGATPTELSLQLGIDERWIYRYNGALEELENQASSKIVME